MFPFIYEADSEPNLGKSILSIENYNSAHVTTRVELRLSLGSRFLLFDGRKLRCRIHDFLLYGVIYCVMFGKLAVIGCAICIARSDHHTLVKSGVVWLTLWEPGLAVQSHCEDSQRSAQAAPQFIKILVVS